jgi:xanthine dehydrogenase accessory factor
VAIEVIRPKPLIIVFGAGHVGQAVALMANMVGYCVTVVDDREAFANRHRLPDPAIEIIAEPFDRAAKSVTITSNTAIVIVTRGHQYDELCLRSVIRSGARYIGMIGSRRRVISVFRQLTESGVAQNLLDRVHAPIGLRIGAKSPQEIAVAILAEIIQTFNAQVADSPSSN